jgi:hypothetical protein
MNTAKRRQQAEAKREAAEHARQSAEVTRDHAEGQRYVSEETRLTAEEMRQDAHRTPPRPSSQALRDLQQRMHHLEARMTQIELHVQRAMDAILHTTQQCQSLLAKQQYAFTQDTAKKAHQMAHDAKQISELVRQRRQAQSEENAGIPHPDKNE